MDYEPNGNRIYAEKVSNHNSRAELNGYDLTTNLNTDEDGNQKLVFTVEKDGDISEKELRYFEIGLKKSLGSFSPNGRPKKRYNNRRNHPNYDQSQRFFREF